MWHPGAWLFPIISACTWLGMLLALFCVWEAQGSPHLPSMEEDQRIAYISDTGAFGLKLLFIAGSSVTVVFLSLAFVSERWLRHYGRLAPNTSRAQSILSTFAIIFAIAGSAGLILLSIFDTYRHDRQHNGFLLLFIGGFVISAIFTCAEYQRLGIHYRQHRILRISFWVKLTFILVEIVLAIVFVSTSFTGHRNVAAIFEWVVAIVFTGYILSFLLDLLPSVRSRSHVPQGWRESELEKGNANGNVDSSQGTPITSDSAGPNQNVDMADSLSGGYRGTAATNDPGLSRYPTFESDTRRQKKWGVGRFKF